MVYNLSQQNTDEAPAWEQGYNAITHSLHENGTLTLDAVHNTIKLAEEQLIVWQQHTVTVQVQAHTATANAATAAPVTQTVNQQLAEIKAMLTDSGQDRRSTGMGKHQCIGKQGNKSGGKQQDGSTIYTYPK